MAPSTRNVSAYRFGSFEVDLRSAEVRKNGLKLKLQDQPYQVLLRLLERRGEVVSREELHSALWREDTFVDFETGLNTAIKRLRETIGDSADHPTFIETVPRRGYKFIASVIENGCEDTKILALGSKNPPLSKNRLTWIGTAGLATALVLSIVFWYTPATPPTVVNTVRITNDFKTKSPGNLSVTDGLYLYFIEGWPSTTGSRIAQLSTAGGETTWIATNLPGPDVIFGISPDRRQLLVADGEGARLGEDAVWVQPLPGGTAHRVGNISASGAAWTPDGQHILYATGTTINLTNNEGNESRLIANVPGDARAFRFSPDGRRVRFWVTQSKGESNSIWEMDANGNNPHPLFPKWEQSSYQCCGNWSPDGRYYYFQAGVGNDEGIWVMPERPSVLGRAPAGSPSRLTTAALRFTTPLPSDDGKKLFVIGSEPRVELSRYDLHARRFDPYFSGLSAGPVDFSSDGKWIAYVSYPDMTLWRSRIDGTDKLQLTFPPVRVYEPRWSPDGSRIAFMNVQFKRPWKIEMLSASGGRPEVLLPANTDEADPTWTPDGESILFGKSTGVPKGIYRLDLKSRKMFSIAGSEGIFSPRLSRDARYISAITENGSKLMLFEIATQRWSTIMQGKELGFNEWSHDGKYVYLTQIWGGAGEVVRVRVEDHLVEHVVSLKDFPQVGGNFTGWIGLTPDDAPLLMRDRSVQELYALDLALH